MSRLQLGQRPLAQPGDIEEIGQQPVPVELDERDEVERHVEQAERAESVEDDRLRPDEQRQAGGAGDDGLHERAGGGVHRPLRGSPKHEIGRVDEERRVAEVEAETGADHPSLRSMDRQGMSQLVEEDGDHQQCEQPHASSCADPSTWGVCRQADRPDHDRG